MRKGVNKVTIVGYLGLDPDVNHASNGAVVTVISVATSESWTNKNTGELMTDTQWHRIVFFGRLAEIAGEYLKKGSQVYIEGKLQTRKWQDNNGQDRYTTEIVANEMQLLGHNPQNLSTTPPKVADNSNNDEPNHAAPTVDDFDDEPF